MNAIERIKKKRHFSEKIQFSFPKKEPYITFIVDSPSETHKKQIDWAFLESKGDTSAITKALLTILKINLTGWKDCDLEYSEENKKEFFENLRAVEEIGIATLFREAINEEEKRIESLPL